MCKMNATPLVSIKVENLTVDNDLKQEIASPGSDHRYGVNLIARPSQAVLAYIAKVQSYLKEHAPAQYYYPPAELHLTCIEICSSCSSFGEVENVAKQVARYMQPFRIIAAPVVSTPMMNCTSNACALDFSQFEALQDARMLIAAYLQQQGVKITPRYLPKSAHITFMRYLAPLTIPLDTWRTILADAPCPPDGLTWRIDRLWLTYGATWYGRRSCITIRKEKICFHL